MEEVLKATAVVVVSFFGVCAVLALGAYLRRFLG